MSLNQFKLISRLCFKRVNLEKGHLKGIVVLFDHMKNMFLCFYVFIKKKTYKACTRHTETYQQHFRNI